MTDNNVVQLRVEVGDDGAIAVEHSEIALAAEFVRRFGHKVRYVAKWGVWLIWDGRRWRTDDTMEIWDRARSVVAGASEALGALNKTAAKAIGSHKTVAAVVGLARSDPAVAAVVDDWDANPWLLNTPGGIVDLVTGEIGCSDQDAYCTKIAQAVPADYVPDDCLWLCFLNRIFDGREDLISFMQRALGYSLPGSTKEEVFFFCYGTGQNGKSKLLSTVSNLLGDYHEQADMTTFTVSKFDQHPADLAKLRGARMVTATETEEGRRWSEAKIKAITGGDAISARFMRQDFFTFRPQLKLWVAGNHKPGLRNVDFAMRRRMNLVPFSVTIPEAERDCDLEEKLKQEWPFILRWLIEGCLEWQRIGLRTPDAVKAATDEYMQAEDVVKQWLDECCEVDRRHQDSFSALWVSWEDWAKRAGEFAGTKKRFGSQLQERGFERGQSGARVYSGLRVLPMHMERQ